MLLNLDFADMTTPTLVVAGDRDLSSRLTVRGAAWGTDPYFLSPGDKSLLTLFGAEHSLGEIPGSPRPRSAAGGAAEPIICRTGGRYCSGKRSPGRYEEHP